MGELLKPKPRSLLADSTALYPTPGFVIKCRLLKRYKGVSPGTKLFVNVCTSPHIPKPAIPNDPIDWGTLFALIANDEWEIPLIVSPDLKTGEDKSGNPALIIDCIIHEKALELSGANEQLKIVLTQWCFDAIELQYNDELLVDRESRVFLNRTHMGKISPIDIQELEDEEDTCLTQLRMNSLQSDISNSLLIKSNLDSSRQSQFHLNNTFDPAPKERISLESIATNPGPATNNSLLSFPTYHKMSSNETVHGYRLVVKCELFDKVLDLKLHYNKEFNRAVLKIHSKQGIKSQEIIELPISPSIGIKAFELESTDDFTTVFLFVK
ncbi:hypothetical protein OGAPHI_003572 [Ogataea philodendri]|uniref:PIH1 N-terminal domain-containing protein n=1 Tax=Ogataea philodendri TaxID=1378263 RepID=A0A9P8T3Y5_9ASCO|nr:uncharacterized protein OGAPHI_003572 [Ogataea philodendri]KAH3665388.1 hypothetical protein OGAPHI_003572 [Ogataea philodendri]